MQSEIFFVGLSNNMFSISTFLVLFLSHFFVSSIEADVFTEVTTPTVYTNNATSVDTVPFNVTSSIDSNHFTDDCDNRDGVCDSSRPIDATGNNGVNGTSSKAVTSTSNDSSPSSIIERTTSAVTNKLKTTNAPDVINATGTIFTNTTTKTTTTTTELETKYTAHVEYCECDIMKDECDINCCCDEDCSSQDKQMFSYCSSALLADSLALSIDFRHCYTSHFLYDNNTKLLKVVKQNSHNLFCIAIDNLEPGLVYKTLPLVKSVKDFNKMLKRFRKGVFSWPESQHIAENAKISTSQIAFNLTEYKADDYIWMFMENTTFIKPLFLPASSSSILFVCNEERPVLYLKNSAHSCLRRIPKSKTECEKTLKYLDMYHFYKDYKVLSAPQSLNSSFPDDCLDESCLTLISSVCLDDDFQVCYENVILRPLFTTDVNICMNVVNRVQYVFTHNGTQGIMQVNINFQLTNVTFFHNQKFYRQHSEVKFYRSAYNGSRQPAPFIRSGRPGYVPGRPIISGKKVIGNDVDLDQHILLSDEQKLWLTIPIAGLHSGGHCDENKRLNVFFLQNMKSECFLQVSSSCESAENKTREILLGENAVNVTDMQQTNIYVSAYGDPNTTDISNWVPVLAETSTDHTRHSRTDKCKNVYTDMNIKILYTYSGPINRPQAKIIGVFMNFSFSDNSIHTEVLFRTLKITSAVSFIDVTRPDDAIIRFADPPVYEIKLPADFFYPFLSRSVNNLPPSLIMIIFIFFISAPLQLYF